MRDDEEIRLAEYDERQARVLRTFAAAGAARGYDVSDLRDTADAYEAEAKRIRADLAERQRSERTRLTPMIRRHA